MERWLTLGSAGQAVFSFSSYFLESFLNAVMPLKSKHVYLFGPFRLDPDQRLLFRGGDTVSLTPKAIETLLVLVENRRQLVTKEELLRRVWPDAFVEEVTLAKNVSIVRKALDETAEGRHYIETHSRRGYRFVAEVQEVEGAPGATEPPEPQPLAVAPSSQRRTKLKWVALLPLVAILVAFAGGVWHRFRSEGRPIEGKIMLAVLPFENLSGDPEQEYFSNGLTEEMITQLGRLEPETLGVIARTSAMLYRGGRKDTRQIAGELGVDYILEGSIRREGGRVRITAQLIQVRDQSHLWAEDYDRDLRDILSMQSEVANSIAQEIRLKLSPEQHARLHTPHPVNPDAYENYLKGRFFWNKRTVEGYRKAIEFFANAIALAPDYAQAYAGLADTYALLGSAPNPVLSRRDAMTRAREAAHKALSLDESLAEAHTSLAFVTMHYDWDFSGAEKEFLRGIALNPGYATAHHWYAYDLVALGRLDDAIAQIHVALKTDPLSVIISRDVAEILQFAGRDEEAVAQCRKTLEMDANFESVHWLLAWDHFRKGRSKEFIEELEKGGSTGLASAIPAMIFAVNGKRTEARRLLAEVERNYVSSTFNSVVYAYLGNKDRAFAWLDKVFEDRNGGLIVIRVAPEYDQLRSDPRFELLARRIGLPSPRNTAQHGVADKAGK